MMCSICILLRVRTRFKTSALWGHCCNGRILLQILPRYSWKLENQEEQEIFPKIGICIEGEISGTLSIHIPLGIKGKMWKIIWKKKKGAENIKDIGKSRTTKSSIRKALRRNTIRAGSGIKPQISSATNKCRMHKQFECNTFGIWSCWPP